MSWADDDSWRRLDRLIFAGRNLRYRALFDVLARYRRGLVIDVGGGRLASARPLDGEEAQRHIVVEPDEAVVASVGLVGRPVVADGCRLPFRTDCADTVLSIQVLEHVVEPIAMFEELYRVLRPGGHLVVMVPQTANLHHVPHHFQNFTRFWLEAMAERVGGEVVEYRPLGGAWASLASRLALANLAPLGVRGYTIEGRRRGWRFWALFPLGLVVNAVVIPFALVLSVADLTEEANNHLMVIRKPQRSTSQAPT